MFRKVISSGDLILEKSYWWSLGKFVPYRNLSEEVRCLRKLEQDAMVKAKTLSYKRNVAEKNVQDELDTLQIFLINNSKASFLQDVEQSILEEREDVNYHVKQDNNKKDSSSNKDQNKQGNNGGGNNSNGGENSKGKTVTLSDLLFKGKIILH